MFAGKSLKSDNINIYHNNNWPTDSLRYETQLFLFEGLTNACVDGKGNACECLDDEGDCIIDYKECKSLVKKKYTVTWCCDGVPCDGVEW